MKQYKRQEIGGITPNITLELLNPLRKVLRKKYTQIEALENLDGLNNIRLIGANFGGVHNRAMYDGIATEKLFNDTRNALIQSGVTTDEHIQKHREFGECKPDGFQDFELYIKADHSYLIAGLRIYGPGYS